MKSWLLLALVGAADSALVVIVDGIPADQLTKQVVQHAVDDVIPIVEAPEQVVNVEFFPVPGYPSSVRIESTVRMGDPWRTCVGRTTLARPRVDEGARRRRPGGHPEA